MAREAYLQSKREGVVTKVQIVVQARAYLIIPRWSVVTRRCREAAHFSLMETQVQKRG